MAIMDMMSPGILLRLRITIYTVLICFSFFIFIGAAVMKDNYDGCPLYADGINDPGPDSNCNYPIAISVIFQLLYLLFRMGLFLLVAFGSIDPDHFFFSDICEFGYVVTDLLSFFFTFIAACILAAGRNDACDECNDYGDWHSANDAAQAGAWISTLLWLFIGVCGLLTAYRGGKIPGMVHSSSSSSSGGTSGGPPNNQYPSQSYQDPLGFS